LLGLVLLLGGVFSCSTGCGLVSGILREAKDEAIQAAREKADAALLLARDEARTAVIAAKAQAETIVTEKIGELKEKLGDRLDSQRAELREKRESGKSGTTDLVLEGLLGLVAATGVGQWVTTHKSEKRKEQRDLVAVIQNPSGNGGG
jgi:vacuolar-type H+-ATPase subunit H